MSGQCTYLMSDPRGVAVMAAIEVLEPCDATTIARHIDVSTESALIYLRLAHDAGKVCRIVTGRQVAWHRSDEPYGVMPGDLPRHLRAPSIFAAGDRAARMQLAAQ